MAPVISVDQYIEKHPQWESELIRLRNLLHSYDLEEGIKWGGPVYMKEGKNLFGLGAFKNHYAIWFFQGGLLEKNTELLVNPQEGKTQAMRQIKFDKTSIVDQNELKKYIEETLSLDKQGKKIETPQRKELDLAEDIKERFQEDKEFEKAFQSLTPGKKREYSDYISQAKREKTRRSRMEKIIPLVLSGKGLNDKYKRG